MDRALTYNRIRDHIETQWAERGQHEFMWTAGPARTSLPRLRVRQVTASNAYESWVHCTIGAWEASAEELVEFFLLSPVESSAHIETLAMLAHRQTDPRHRVGLRSTVEIGRPWLEGSRATYLFVSLPHSVGPTFEWCHIDDETHVRFLWLVPITAGEAAYARERGAAALESLLETSGINVVDFMRVSLI